jgi:hypothetical protein
MTRTQSSSRNRAVNVNQTSSNATRKSEPAPRAPRAVSPQIDPNQVDDEIQAEVEAQLAAQRAEITAKLVAEKTERERVRRAEEARKARETAAARATTTKAESPDEVSDAELAKFQKLLAASGVRLVKIRKVPARRRVPSREEADGAAAAADDYSDTEHVQVGLLELLDKLGVVRTRDVIENVRHNDGAPMTPSNVRYHMRKLVIRGLVKKIEEPYHLKHLGWRTRDAWSKDPQKLLELLEGKKTVRS